jgi:hypothetical protein
MANLLFFSGIGEKSVSRILSRIGRARPTMGHLPNSSEVSWLPQLVDLKTSVEW